MSLGSIPHCCKAIDSTILSQDLLPAEPVVVRYIRGTAAPNALIPLGDLLFGPLAFAAGCRGENTGQVPAFFMAHPQIQWRWHGGELGGSCRDDPKDESQPHPQSQVGIRAIRTIAP